MTFRLITEDLINQYAKEWTKTPIGKFSEEDRYNLILMRLGREVMICYNQEIGLDQIWPHIDLVNAMSDEEFILWKLKNL